MKIVFWKRKTIGLGAQNVTELTILEYKKLFSIKLFKFHKTDGKQDRFHTHAFNAYSFLLKGNYIEEVLDGDVIKKLPRNRSRVLFIPKDSFHRITKSTNCTTILITGPWGKTFKELTDVGGGMYKETECGEGRKVLSSGKLRELYSEA